MGTYINRKNAKVFLLLGSLVNRKTNSKVLELINTSDMELAINIGHELYIFDIMEEK